MERTSFDMHGIVETTQRILPTLTCGGPSDSGMKGGNIRDTDTSVSPGFQTVQVLALYDWGVTFDEAIESANCSSCSNKSQVQLQVPQVVLT